MAETIEDYKKVDEILQRFCQTIPSRDKDFYLVNEYLVDAWKAADFRRLTYNEAVYLSQNIRMYLEVDRSQDKKILEFVMANIGENAGASLMKYTVIGALILGIVLFSGKKKTAAPKLHGLAAFPRRNPGNRLFYMLETDRGFITVYRKDLERAKRGKIPLYAVYARNAEEARQKIASGRAERYKGLAGANYNCAAWFKTVDKNGKEISRCFVYAPKCKTRSCIVDTAVRKAEGWKPSARRRKSISGIGELLSQEYVNQRYKEILKYKIPADSGIRLDYSEAGLRAYLDELKIGMLKNLQWEIDRNFNEELSKLDRTKDPKTRQKELNYLNWNQAKIPLTSEIARRAFDIYKPKKRSLRGNLMSCKQYIRDAKGRLRCKKYAPTCNSETECISQPAEIPWNPKPKKIAKAELKAIAKGMADEMNETLDATKIMLRRVLDYGGIAPHRGGYETEEYQNIPTKYKRRDGIPVDELAQELGLTETDLVSQINRSERTYQDIMDELHKSNPKRRRFSYRDFMTQAHDQVVKVQRGISGLSAGIKFPYSLHTGDNVIYNGKVWKVSYIDRRQRAKGHKIRLETEDGNQVVYAFPDDIKPYRKSIAEQTSFLEPSQISLFGRKKIYGEDFFSPRQQELFPGMRRELVMEVQDAATSADPVNACLERKGWNLPKIIKYQESIADKLTPDMFGNTQKLNASETMFQDQVQECLDKIARAR